MRIAIVGSGQLAKMMAEAGQTFNFEFVFLADKTEDHSPIKGLGDIVYYSGKESASALYQAMRKPDVITVEKEDVDIELLNELKHFCPVHPHPDILAITKNRISEKTFLWENQLPVADFRIVKSAEQLADAVEALGLPLIVKSAEQGYDGKSQWRLMNREDVQQFIDNFPNNHLVAEQWVKFSKEISIIGVRNTRGEIVFYSMTENRHENGILITSRVRRRNAPTEMERQAQSMMKIILEKTRYVGVLAMECFVIGRKLIINELAPRVHNSGHWTQSGAVCSQFENHLRAISGMTLGNTRTIANTAMINILGIELNNIEIAIPNAKLHWYNKSPKPGRKLGHINLTDSKPGLLEQQVQELEQHLYS